MSAGRPSHGETVPDQSVTFTLDPQRWAEFVALLDRAPRGLSSMPKLVALMQRPSPFQPSLFDEEGSDGK